MLHEKFQAMDLNGDGLLEWASGEAPMLRGPCWMDRHARGIARGHLRAH